MKVLARFRGGLKLPGFKELSNRSGVRELPLPDRLYLPLGQHAGEPAVPVVATGEYVYKGQCIAQSASGLSAPVHASTSGIIIGIEPHALPHPSGIAADCLILQADGLDSWEPGTGMLHEPAPSPQDLRQRIAEAGIVGLGGAVFPSAVKLSPPRNIDTLILNGVECEPYITCDDALMRARPQAILRGLLLLRNLLEPQRCIVAVEDNKPEALGSLRSALERFRAAAVDGAGSIELVAVPTRFPAGGEKQLIKALTGLEVAPGGLPYELGVVCLNVGTAAAVHNVIYDGHPLVSRVVTVTGSGVSRPGNFQVPLGTPVEHLISAAGGMRSGRCRLVMGGPMMGHQLHDPSVPVVKATNCILVEEVPDQVAKPAMPCIRCGACAGACPMHLVPQQLYWHARGKAFDRLVHFGLGNCIECGCCAVVCPSRIPLVQYFRRAKSEAREQDERSRFASQSRLRTQQRETRLEQDAREKAERKARRKSQGRRNGSGEETTATHQGRVRTGAAGA